MSCLWPELTVLLLHRRMSECPAAGPETDPHNPAFQNVMNIGVSSFRPGKANIVGNRPTEQEVLLLHDPKTAMQRMALQAANVMAVDQHSRPAFAR